MNTHPPRFTRQRVLDMLLLARDLAQWQSGLRGRMTGR
jgi:hypothetical protein